MPASVRSRNDPKYERGYGACAQRREDEEPLIWADAQGRSWMHVLPDSYRDNNKQPNRDTGPEVVLSRGMSQAI